MKVVWIIPCLNEEASIAKVVHDCREALPYARILVVDNASTDRTATEAQRAGAEVLHSPNPGKGNALRHAFRTVQADYYVMIDGDGTYPAAEAERLLGTAISQHQDMVMGSRLALAKPEAFRPMHYSGNLIFSLLTRILFRKPVVDLLTGLRVFSRHFVDSLELKSEGFEIETELTVLAIKHGLPFVELEIPYSERAPESRSKLKTFRDGWKILRTMFQLWLQPKPEAPAKSDRQAA